ncbi:hypothetical predicted multi-pass transmembrane protein [Leishmania donovani]|uniref:Hypothetical predicted multi-pass transmembrane protein n=1 Tax=Leishmania donovani TaxID=5661 RepID=A0A3S7WYQ2_LEIDO|nr:hypothetical predicted multi-pass transmembrane protein [Leishmania donovani]AYU79317.1 hypothetical protein LdCL_240028800 [Leishmania donovani]TPP52351.1 hypothetical protein CGC21_16730 [Leishmania donovani]CBZ34619.1 hypothetical predicted multi-pass transmembrane protein [Leishmania donovani]
MNELERKRRTFRIWLAIYIIFALAYLSGVLLFCFVHQNYWACGGFVVVILLIALRVALLATPQYRLYKIFPPCSFSRIAYQTFFLCACLVGISLGVWLMARGIKHRQSWTARSYFCGMTGMWMAAKWSYIVTVPIYDLREDTLEEDALIRLGLIDSGKDKASGSNEPVTLKANCA